MDSTSQALTWIRDAGRLGGIFEYYRMEHERVLAYVNNRTVHLGVPQGVSHFSIRTGEQFAIGLDGTVWVTELDAGPLRAAGFVELNRSGSSSAPTSEAA